jgi:transcription elongation factor Elf1
LYNFSCPICGDSATNERKARGYIFDKNGKMLYHCHNCGVTTDVPKFIKMIDQTLYNEMMMEKLKGEKTDDQKEFETFVDKMKKPKFLSNGPLKGLKKVSQLPPDHRVKKFVESRRIPNPFHAVLFSCPNFKQYTNNLVPGKFESSSLERDETRLLIPFMDANKNVHAYQGRALGKSAVKYITIVLDESVPKVYGLDRVNWNSTVYVFEGPIDSMFVPNSIATAGGDLISAVSTFAKDSMVIVYDNEPRNKETIKKMDKAILNGYRVCVWPDNLDHKDVNDMVLAGLSPEFIKHIIDKHTYRDLAAKLALIRWSKV